MADVALSARVCVGCGQPAQMQCPTCLSLKLPPSPFCSQTCFKANWATHKAVHAPPVTTSNGHVAPPAGYNPFPGYPYTGELRPWPYGPVRTVPAHIARPEYAESSIPVSEQKAKQSSTIEVMSPAMIEKLRKVGLLGREVLDLAAAAIRPGVTCDEIDRIVHEACVERNAYPSPLNYYKFPKSCCTSVNEVICHGIPDTRPLQDGDIVNVDVSVFHDGVHSDLNETFFVGKVDDAGKHLVKAAWECLDKAIQIVKPGVLYRDVGNVIQKHATANKVSVVRSYCGHGVHSLFHCAPNVPHYAKNKAVGVMKPGHVFTIEPMINEGTYMDETWPDDWTSVTRDGKRSAQFEHTLLVTETGCEVLTRRRDHDGLPHFMTQAQ